MVSPSTELGLFSSLPKWKAPWYEFVLSYGTQAVVIAILAWVPVLHPEILEGPKKDYHAIELVPTPVPVDHTPQRQLPRPVLLAKLDPPPSALRLPAPQPQPKPKVEDAPAPEVKIATRKLDPIPPSNAPVIPKQIVRTNVFSTGSSAPQTIERPPQQVQTGGFGDPNGIPAKTTQTRAVNIAQSGGFDMPTGPGYGNGTGGATGARGVVASTGFGNGVATGNSNSLRATGTPFAKPGSVMPMFLHRPRSRRTLRPRRLPKLCRRKSFPSRLPSTLMKHASSALKVRCFCKSFLKHPVNFAC